MYRFARSVAPFSLPLVLAACAAVGGSVAHTTFIDMRYYPNQVGARGGPMPVEVRGMPPNGADAAAVVAAMRLPAHTGPMRAVPATPGETGPRIVVAFGAASGGRLCEPSSGGATGGLTRLVMSGAYCVGDVPYTSTIVESGSATGPGDGGAFEQAAAHLGQVLLPVYNPEHVRRRGSL